MSSRRKKLLVALATALVAVGCVLGWIYAVPFPEETLAPESLTSTVLVDRQSRPLQEVLNGLEGRSRWLPLASISPNLIDATIHAEDRRFRDHLGVDGFAIARSITYNLQRQKLWTGASTITQQTVKLVMYRDAERTVTRKLMEAVWALRLEQARDKDAILEQYLNRVPYGNQLFGAEAAARMYFDKPASSLSIAEAAFLAGLPQAPSTYNPYRHFERAKARQELILDLMLERGALTPDAHARARVEPIHLRERRTHRRAAHFAAHIIGGLPSGGPLPPTVETTLDLELQEQVEGVVNAHLRRIESRNVSQGAAVVLNTRTGEVLAWVGSRDYDDAAREGANDGVIALRQPGSTLKPFVYGLYLESGGTAADMIADLPIQFPTSDGVYVPHNFDQKTHGPVSVRHALGSSLNIPAVTVAAEVGPERLLDRLHEAGLATLDQPADYYGLGLALGDGEVRLIDLATAYAALGRGGRWRPHQTLRGPSPLIAPSQPERRIFDDVVVATLLDILSDDTARSVGYGQNGPLQLPFRVAAKTGTSTNFRDSWAVGVTPEYTVAVWVGNFDGEPMNRVAGATGAAPILRQVFQTLYPRAAGPADVPWFRPPRGMTRQKVCTLSGQPATEHCRHTRTELFAPGRNGASAPPSIGATHGPGPDTCQLHVPVRVDVRNDLRAGSACPPDLTRTTVFHNLPPAWRAWAHDEGLEEPPTAWSPLCPPTPDDLRALDAALPPLTIAIAHPLDGDTFVIEPDSPDGEQRLTLRVHTTATDPLTWFVDGRPIAHVEPPYLATWPLERGEHRIGVGREGLEREVGIEVR